MLAGTVKLGYNKQLGTGKIRLLLPGVGFQGGICSILFIHRCGTEINLKYLFVITEFVITEFVITEFAITKFVITEFVITEFVIAKLWYYQV